MTAIPAAAAQDANDLSKISSTSADETESSEDDIEDNFQPNSKMELSQILSYPPDSDYVPPEISNTAKEKCAVFTDIIKKLPNYADDTSSTREWMIEIHAFLNRYPELEVIFEPQQEDPVYTEIKSIIPNLNTKNVHDSQRFAKAMVQHINNTLFDIQSLNDLPRSDRNIQFIYNLIKKKEDQVFLDGIQKIHAYLLKYYSNPTAYTLTSYERTLNSILPRGKPFVETYLTLTAFRMIQFGSIEKRNQKMFPLLVEHYKRILRKNDKALQPYLVQIKETLEPKLHQQSTKLFSPITHDNAQEGSKKRTTNSKKSKFGNGRSPRNNFTTYSRSTLFSNPSSSLLSF